MTMSLSNTVRQFESLINLSILAFYFQNMQISTVYEDLVSSVFVQVSGNEDLSSNIVRSKIKKKENLFGFYKVYIKTHLKSFWYFWN